MRHFSIELLKESPSPALQTCARLAQLQVLLLAALLHIFYDYNCYYYINHRHLQPFVGRELFTAGFVSWAQLNETSQRQLVRQLETAFSSPNIPPEILATLLNLVYFHALFPFLVSCARLCNAFYFVFQYDILVMFNAF